MTDRNNATSEDKPDIQFLKPILYKVMTDRNNATTASPTATIINFRVTAEFATT